MIPKLTQEQLDQYQRTCLKCGKKFSRRRYTSGQLENRKHFLQRKKCNECRTRISPKHYKKAIELRNAGRSYKEIALKLGITKSGVAFIFKRKKHPVNAHIFSDTVCRGIKICLKCGAPPRFCTKVCPSPAWISEIEKRKLKVLEERTEV